MKRNSCFHSCCEFPRFEQREKFAITITSHSPKVYRLNPVCLPRKTCSSQGYYLSYPQSNDVAIPKPPAVRQSQNITDRKTSAYYLNKRLDNVRDFTRNTAMSGLSSGEKFIFWLFNRISVWSKNWFTHLFLLLILIIYSLFGACMFQFFEGNHERLQLEQVNRNRENFLNEIRSLLKVNLTNDGDKDHEWYRFAIDLLKKYEQQQFNTNDLVSGSVTNKTLTTTTAAKTWTLWNSLFFCGTIYTTIAKEKMSTKSDEVEFLFERKKRNGCNDAASAAASASASAADDRFACVNFDEIRELFCLRQLNRKCFINLVILIVVCGVGAIAFRTIEGTIENFYKCGVKRVKRDFIEHLWKSSQYLREDDWKMLARSKLRTFEDQLQTAHEAGLRTYSGQRSWSFLNSAVYCLTIVTTIGYGHIYPITTTGKALTIVYAIFGIPLFLIILTDFGKLFTRGIKFCWAFIRRLYYTGSCRRVRRHSQIQDVMKNMKHYYVQIRKHSNPKYANEKTNRDDANNVVKESATFEINDEFNLPISVAFLVLVAYILFGAFIYSSLENWTFFEAFYFVFISMSTIGFGDYVPQHPMYMIASIAYLMFGLALTSMFINVVQLRLTEAFQQASAKLSSTMGFNNCESADEMINNDDDNNCENSH